MVECVLTWIREQYLVVCNTAKWTILCIVCFHNITVTKLLQKGVRVHHRRVILMQKNAIFFWGGGIALSPDPSPSILTPPILKLRRRYCWKLPLNVYGITRDKWIRLELNCFQEKWKQETQLSLTSGAYHHITVLPANDSRNESIQRAQTSANANI